MDRVRGQCPACGSESLFIGDSGHVTCSVLGCEDPCAADKVLHGECPTSRCLLVEVSCTPAWNVGEAKGRVASGVSRLLRDLQAEGVLDSFRGFSVNTRIEEES